jgi:uncharacterized membrane protein (DUF485 family)
MQHHHLTAREWDKLAADPQFQALLRERRRFVIPASIFFLLFYLSLPIGIAIAPTFMGKPAFGGLTVAFALGLLQFVMAWGVLFLYMREAKIFDLKAEAIATRAHEEFAP